jgi:hypothetical protein
LIAISACKDLPAHRIASTVISMTEPFPAAGGPSLSPLTYENPALVLNPAFAGIRLDEVEKEVFRFEQKSELINEHDALHRGTIGARLDKHELFKTATGRYAITTVGDCQGVGENTRVTCLSQFLSRCIREHSPEVDATCRERRLCTNP